MANNPSRAPRLCLIRGAGDIASGIAWRLSRAGWPIVATELAQPLAVRRTVSLSSAVSEGSTSIEGMRGERADSLSHATELANAGVVAVLVSPSLPALNADVVIDARLAKRNLDTSLDDAELVVGIGPGFEASQDCHAVVETQRGHHLGRVFWTGHAAANTGIPGTIDGRGAERVLRSPAAGVVTWAAAIGDAVTADQELGSVAGQTVYAPFDGMVRGLIQPGLSVIEGFKIGDLDPRCGLVECHEISDKALAVGGGVVEAILCWLNGHR